MGKGVMELPLANRLLYEDIGIKPPKVLTVSVVQESGLYCLLLGWFVGGIAGQFKR
jgi:hypothetical protein